MNAIAKTIQLATFNIRNTLFAIFIVLVIVALFFIPEIIDWRLSRQSPESVPAASSNLALNPSIESSPDILESELSAPVIGQSRQDSSPLEGVIADIDAGQYDKPVRAESEAEVRIGETETQVATVDQKLFSTPTFNWDTVKGENAQNAFAKAQAQARNLLTTVEKSKIASHQALYNYIAGVNFVLSEGDKVMTARQALTYLEGLDLAVAYALKNENASRNDYIKWMQVSMQSAFGYERTQRIKQEMLNPFDPQIRLTKIDIHYIPPAPGSQKTEPLTNIFIQGTLTGKDIRKLTILRNGRFVADVQYGAPDQDNLRGFYFSNDNATGIWTFKAVDRLDNEYKRYYQFFPKVQAFPLKSGAFVLPYDWQLKDPRIDKLFYVKEVKGPYGEGDANFSRF